MNQSTSSHWYFPNLLNLSFRVVVNTHPWYTLKLFPLWSVSCDMLQWNVEIEGLVVNLKSLLWFSPPKITSLSGATLATLKWLSFLMRFSSIITHPLDRDLRFKCSIVLRCPLWLSHPPKLYNCVELRQLTPGESILASTHGAVIHLCFDLLSISHWFVQSVELSTPPTTSTS